MSEEKPSLPADYKVPKVWEYKEQGGQFGGTNRPFAGAWKGEGELPKGEHALQLYSLGTPNGVKVTIMLEELVELFPDFEYDAWLQRIDGNQFLTGFNNINPNSKIPAMVDHSDPAKPVRVFESGAIMLYLAEKFDKDGVFFPKEYPMRAECQSWLMWQMGSAPFIGGGFGHFYNYAPIKIEYAIDRYTMETKRLIDVLEKHLESAGPYVCGEQYTIADMAIWPWIGNLVLGKLYGAAEFLEVAKYTRVLAWANLIAERPAVKRGRMVNRPYGELSEQLHERHSRADFETKTQDKLQAAASA
eukprot:TRINITY_DN58599_c0_g1_i1.p1 TRINITY_DN58599_c0_g1~~TRINITY_DN58599_c0_g1_i1.p1  ORF type:complete len:330 (+),score=47.81 TRINITY_DN58599_c0_g1_i1:85-990(+)